MVKKIVANLKNTKYVMKNTILNDIKQRSETKYNTGYFLSTKKAIKNKQDSFNKYYTNIR